MSTVICEIYHCRGKEMVSIKNKFFLIHGFFFDLLNNAFTSDKSNLVLF